LVEWCNTNIKVDELLQEVQRRNPGQFRRWEPLLKHPISDDLVK